MSKSYFVRKRIIDYTLSIILLVLLSPLFLLLGLIIFLETRKNPFFVQERGLSLDVQRIRLIKFRTMYEDVDIKPSSKNYLKKYNSTRYITKFGRFLRKSGLDELPQLVNVLKGEMSLVGFRPLSLADLTILKENYAQFYEWREQSNVKLGLVGLWQIKKDEKHSFQNFIEQEREYCLKRNTLFDLIILLRSVFLVLTLRHRDSIIN